MIYEISGADRTSGKERVLKIEADSEDAALAEAKRQGVFTFNVKKVPSAPAPVFTETLKDAEKQAATDSRPCPYCGEKILTIAKKCKHCGEVVDDALLKQLSETEKSLSKLAIGCLGLMLLVVLFPIVAIVTDSGSSSSNDAGSTIGFADSSESTSEAIGAVQDSITGPAPSRLSFKEGPLQGGTAVLVAGNAAYWVKDGTVYAANGFAKTWSPSLKYSPVGIDFSSVKSAVSDD